jgi:hypothetical protein
VYHQAKEEKEEAKEISRWNTCHLSELIEARKGTERNATYGDSCVHIVDAITSAATWDVTWCLV